MSSQHLRKLYVPKNPWLKNKNKKLWSTNHPFWLANIKKCTFHDEKWWSKKLSHCALAKWAERSAPYPVMILGSRAFQRYPHNTIASHVLIAWKVSTMHNSFSFFYRRRASSIHLAHWPGSLTLFTQLECGNMWAGPIVDASLNLKLWNLLEVTLGNISELLWVAWLSFITIKLRPLVITFISSGYTIYIPKAIR